MADLYVCLSEADQKRYECGPRLSVSLLDTTAWEQATLQAVFKYHTPEDVLDALRAMLPRDENAKPRRNPHVVLALSWLALRQNGHLKARRSDDLLTELSELQIQSSRMQFDSDAEGKDGEVDSTPTKT